MIFGNYICYAHNFHIHLIYFSNFSFLSMISPRGRINLSIGNRSPSQKLTETQKVYIPQLTYRKKLIKNNSTDLAFSDRRSKEKKNTEVLAQLNQCKNSFIKSYSTKKLNIINSSRMLKDQIAKLTRGKLIAKSRKSVDKQKCCRILITDCNQELQHYVQVTSSKSIIQYLNKFYSNVYFRCSPPNLVVDYMLTQGELPAEFLNGKSLYLKSCRKGTSIKDRISLKDFQIIKPIGSGGFSKVFLCRFKDDGNFYAIKLIDKDVIVKNKKKKIIMNERNIMKQADHPFIIDMKFAFETEKYLAFVLQYCAGGQLFGLIRKYRKISEQVAKFYIIQILLGLQYLHKNQIVYRDIKPENILLTIDGHVKIADLGLAKPNMVPRQLAYSFCGSPQYMSPEMIMQVGHTFPVDHYCVGALLYQLLTGLPPFYSRDPNQIYQAVLSQELEIPHDVPLTKPCVNLLKSLLCKDTKHRLGSIHGIRQILAHPWFGKNDYSKLLKKQVPPPQNFLSVQKLKLNKKAENSDEKGDKQLNNVFKQQNKQKGQVQFKKVMKQFYYDYRQSQGQKENKIEGLTKRNSGKLSHRDINLLDNFQKRKNSNRSASKTRTSRL